jgi:hypothetical protein
MIEHIEQGALAPNIRACIALTSWKKRINTVGLTIYNLFETCGPDYHIVLTLAEEEFPKKEQELPRDLVLMNRAGVFEILWVSRNWRSFKKWVFCSMRYPDMPIITADDDCIYTHNYASELLSHLSPGKSCVTYWCDRFKRTKVYNTAGYATCYSPGYFGDVSRYMVPEILEGYDEDDMLYVALRYILGIMGCVCLNKAYEEIAIPHDEIDPLHDMYKGRKKDKRDKMIDRLISLLEK